MLERWGDRERTRPERRTQQHSANHLDTDAEGDREQHQQQYAALQGRQILCLRGAESDLVLRETTAEMLTRGPGARGLAQVVEVPGCGHAPALNVPEHSALVDGFLAKAG